MDLILRKWAENGKDEISTACPQNLRNRVSRLGREACVCWGRIGNDSRFLCLSDAKTDAILGKEGDNSFTMHFWYILYWPQILFVVRDEPQLLILLPQVLSARIMDMLSIISACSTDYGTWGFMYSGQALY